MFSVFNTNLQTDMGKTIVRRHLASTDAQAVWKELSEHMKTSSKGASEKRRLTQYVTNTVLDDNFKGTTEQFVLHFNEQFRQLEEISEDDERLPSSVKLTLLQTAVKIINDLRIVETLDQFQSTTHGHGSSTSLSYVIQFPPEMDENWVRYGLAKLGQISKLPNWQRMRFCAYTTQLLHSTGEVCWNNKDSYFIWFELVCRNSGQIASRRSWKRSCLGLEYTSKCSRLAPLWEPN